MEPVVDASVAGCLGMPGGQSILDALAIALYGEVDHRCRATPRRSSGAGLESVRSLRAAEGQFQMGMGINAARDEVLACRVDDRINVFFKIKTEQR